MCPGPPAADRATSGAKTGTPDEPEQAFRPANEPLPDKQPHDLLTTAAAAPREVTDHAPENELPADLLPYPARPGQMELAGLAHNAFGRGEHAVLEAGTGTGKTVAVLAAVLRAAADQDRRVVWLTRTNSQAQQVLVELNAILQSERSRTAIGGQVLALALQGRHHLCPQLANDPRYHDADAEEFARLCGSLKKATRQENPDASWAPDPSKDPEHEETVAGTGKLPMAPTTGCGYYAGLLDTEPQVLVEGLMQAPMDAQRLARSLEGQGICPYEAVKGLMAQARLVVAPYVYLADRRLARAMEEWLTVPLSECLVVVDEAHNLADQVRSLYSPELSIHALDRALSEAKTEGDPLLADAVHAKRLVQAVKTALGQAAADRLTPEREDARITPDEINVSILTELGITTPRLVSVVHALAARGEQVRAKALQAGRLPRSHLAAFARFLAAWLQLDLSVYAPVVVKGKGPRLVLYCLDPAQGAAFLTRAHSSVHISGTLRPLDQHRDLLGLPDGATHLRSLPSPFPAGNLRTFLVDDVTTRYEERQRDASMMDRLAAHVRSFAEADGVNAMVLVPSHAFLEEMKGLVFSGLDREIFFERPGMAQSELEDRLHAFREAGQETASGGEGALWVGVMGGRVSEGMDFPGRSLQAACLVGVPYPRPTARLESLVQFNDFRFSKGWEYAVQAPTLRRVLQSVGRVVRDHSDQGIVFLLDARYRRWAHEVGRLERLGDEESLLSVVREWQAGLKSRG